MKPTRRWFSREFKLEAVRLVVAERRLERHGMPERKALDAAFAPFPVGGLAVWSDTWGAPRYAGGYHPHHGQDLLCAEGTPLLAIQPGVVEFGSDPLGGTTIELTLRDGSFWYYAHLDHYALKGLGHAVHVASNRSDGLEHPAAGAIGAPLLALLCALVAVLARRGSSRCLTSFL